MKRILQTLFTVGLLAGTTIFGSGCVAFVPLIEPDYQPILSYSRTAMVPECGAPGSPEAAREAAPLENDDSSNAAGVLAAAVVAPKPMPRPVVDQRKVRMQRLIRQLKAETAVARTHAASDLGFMGPYAISAIQPLAYALKHDDNKWVRRAAAKSLGKIGTSGALQPLRGALSDRNKWVAHSAANALRKLERQLNGSPQRAVMAPAQPPMFKARGDTVREL